MSLSQAGSITELSLSCETSKAQSDAEIRSLPKAGYCLTIASTQVEVRTGRIYFRVNGNPWIEIQGGRQQAKFPLFLVSTTAML